MAKSTFVRKSFAGLVPLLILQKLLEVGVLEDAAMPPKDDGPKLGKTPEVEVRELRLFQQDFSEVELGELIVRLGRGKRREKP